MLSQTFRAVIHSRMKVGMEKYKRSIPDADVVLFEPDREDADMFFANIFSYSQRRRLCATAFATTRYNLRVRAPTLAPSARATRDHASARTGSPIRRATCARRWPIRARSAPTARAQASVRATARGTSAHTLDQLERWLRVAR